MRANFLRMPLENDAPRGSTERVFSRPPQRAVLDHLAGGMPFADALRGLQDLAEHDLELTGFFLRKVDSGPLWGYELVVWVKDSERRPYHLVSRAILEVLQREFYDWWSE